MNKEEALKKIKELQQYVEECDNQEFVVEVIDLVAPDEWEEVGYETFDEFMDDTNAFFLTESEKYTYYLEKFGHLEPSLYRIKKHI